jgi:hypothetical protein
VANQVASGRRWLPRLNVAGRPRLLVLIGTISSVTWVLAWKSIWANSAPLKNAIDPSIVISTFIALNGSFLTGFGVLGGLVAAKKQARKVLRFVAIFFLIESHCNGSAARVRFNEQLVQGSHKWAKRSSAA